MVSEFVGALNQGGRPRSHSSNSCCSSPTCCRSRDSRACDFGKSVVPFRNCSASFRLRVVAEFLRSVILATMTDNFDKAASAQVKTEVSDVSGYVVNGSFVHHFSSRNTGFPMMTDIAISIRKYEANSARPKGVLDAFLPRFQIICFACPTCRAILESSPFHS